jgi:hypothetical protein
VNISLLLLVVFSLLVWSVTYQGNEFSNFRIYIGCLMCITLFDTPRYRSPRIISHSTLMLICCVHHLDSNYRSSIATNVCWQTQLWYSVKQNIICLINTGTTLLTLMFKEEIAKSIVNLALCICRMYNYLR